MKYIVIIEWNDEDEFMERVNKYLNSGYTLVGSVSVACDNENVIFVQALTR